MPAKLTKPISRETNRRYHNRPVILTIAPAGSQEEALIGMRLKGTRARYVMALSDLFRIAALWHGQRLNAAKRAARKAGIPWRRARRDFERTLNLHF
jgi:hypothetical protein